VADRGEIERAAARPMAYFSHDSNSAHDIKCRKLIRREGMAGYGRWWRLCELMAATDGHALEIGTDEDMELYAEELGYGTTEHAVVDSKTFRPCSIKKRLPALYEKINGNIKEIV
jgi:hypothetical protein